MYFKMDCILLQLVLPRPNLVSRGTFSQWLKLSVQGAFTFLIVQKAQFKVCFALKINHVNGLPFL